MLLQRNTIKDSPRHTNYSQRPVSGQVAPERLGFWVRNRAQLIHIAGAFCLLFALFTLFAFVSYLVVFYAEQQVPPDFNIVTELDLAGLLDAKTLPIENWMGLWGALLAHSFLYSWFGLASFGFLVGVFILGFRLLFKLALVPMYWLIFYLPASILFVSVCFGFLASLLPGLPHYLSGYFGFQLNAWLVALLGSAGTFGFLFFIVLVAIIALKNPSFAIRKKAQKSAVLAAEKPEPTDDSHAVAEVAIPAKGHAGWQDRPADNLELIIEKPLGDIPAFPDQAACKTPDFKAKDLPLSEPEKVLTATASAAADDFSVVIRHEEKLSKQLVDKFGSYDPKLELSRYTMPSLDLLTKQASGSMQVDAQELESNKNTIIETLRNYGIEIAKIKATVGPTVTLYEIIPVAGVRISKIKNLEDDIALSLSALGIRIIAPMPGKGTVGIEVPNKKREVVSMHSVLATEKYQKNTMDLPIALGKTISNEVYITDLAKMPHLLMAGATGQGKSVGINVLIASLLYKKHPSQLKFVFVDPKKVELSLFKKIERHFLAKLPGEEDAILTDTKKVVCTLNALCIEMDQRYELLKAAGVRHLKEYNQKFIARKLNPEKEHRYLPYIVLVIDEFADLIMTAGKEIEMPIARLAQLARAIGIHLVIATQRPSVNVITGIIKANFPARMAFRVSSKIDGRTILDTGGADQLIGKGDLLLSIGSDLIRLQCPLLDTPEVERIIDYIGEQQGYAAAYQLPEYIEDEKNTEVKNLDAAHRDALFEDAARVVVLNQQGSTSLIQRKLKIGYNRAGSIIDQLEAAGIVGPFQGSKTREVHYLDEQELNAYLRISDSKQSPINTLLEQ